MKHYRELAVRYLKMNKRRSTITVIGVAVAVTVLYTLLNLGWCALLQYRERIRVDRDYEMILFTELEEQIDRITSGSGALMRAPIMMMGMMCRSSTTMRCM